MTFPTIQYEKGKFMNETFDIMQKLTQDHGVDNTKLDAWHFMVKSSEEGSAGPSVMQRYFYLLNFAKEQHGGKLDNVKAALWGPGVEPTKIPALEPQWMK